MTIEPWGDHLVVLLRGELDIATAPVLARELSPLLDGRPVIIDLSELAFLGAAGLAVLARAHMRSRTLGGHMVVRSPTPPMDQVFRVTGLAHLLEAGAPTLPAAAPTLPAAVRGAT